MHDFELEFRVLFLQAKNTPKTFPSKVQSMMSEMVFW